MIVSWVRVESRRGEVWYVAKSVGGVGAERPTARAPYEWWAYPKRNIAGHNRLGPFASPSVAQDVLEILVALDRIELMFEPPDARAPNASMTLVNLIRRRDG